MNRIVFIICLLLATITATAQEHISFNGATFGQTQKEFQSSLNGHPSTSYLISHSNKNLYNRYFYTDVPLSTYTCKMFMHCSVRSNIVFETITWFRATNLKEELKYFVQIFEEKYGEHISEAQSDLGYINDGRIGSASIDKGYYEFSVNYSDSFGDHHKEMLALKYTIHRKKDNKAIGEIRISAAPISPSSNYGYIEITYRDFAAAESAIGEYNSIMNSIL